MIKKKQTTAILDEYESQILKAFERGELNPVKESADFKEIARNTLKKNKKINIRIPECDLTSLQQKAAREGIPCQTLIGSVLHKYACGYLKDVA